MVRCRLNGSGAYAARTLRCQSGRDLVERLQLVDRAERGERELALQQPARDAAHGVLVDRLDAGHDLGVGDRPAMDDQVAGRLLQRAPLNSSAISVPALIWLRARTSSASFSVSATPTNSSHTAGTSSARSSSPVPA